jgi:hypothetical protein
MDPFVITLGLWCLPSFLVVGFAEWHSHRSEHRHTSRHAIVVPFPARRIYRHGVASRRIV